MFKSEAQAINLLNDSSIRKLVSYASNGQYLNFVFLCGKAKAEGDNRDFITKYIVGRMPFLYSLYSEEVFPLFHKPNLDLLRLEEVLADISTAILIIVESLGSACELGAFAFLDKTISKLWVINDVQYCKEESFISTGPLEKIKTKAGPEHVLYEKFSDDGIICFSTAAEQTIRGFSRQSFFKEPFQLSPDGKSYVIRDVGCLVCLLFEYVFRFGFLRMNNLSNVINVLTRNKGGLPLQIRLSSDNLLDIKQTQEVLNSLPFLLRTIGLFQSDKRLDEEYYRLNENTLTKRSADMNKLTSLIFYSSRIGLRDIRSRISKIKNMAIKEGFRLWA